jgi:hypothetical protein
MLHGFAPLAFFAERTAKPLWDYRIANRQSPIANWESGIANREVVSCRAFLKHFSPRLSINLEPSPPRTFSPSRFCNRCVWLKKRASALIKLYSQKYYLFKFLYYR